MLTVSTIQLGKYHNLPKKEPTKVTHPPINKGKGNDCYAKNYSPIYFLGEINKGIERPPTRESTLKALDSIYDNYEKQLNTITREDIKGIISELENESNFSRKEILESMQVLTQFGNMNSLKVIGENLSKNNIGIVPNNGLLFHCYQETKLGKKSNNFGLNASLDYLIQRKDNYKLTKCGKIGMFLDNNKLNELSKLKIKSPGKTEAFINHPCVDFFIISGLEEGISFFNREKDLKEETKKLLLKSKEYNLSPQETINIDKITKAHELNIYPIIIKNNNEATVENIYNQLKPEKISKEELLTVLDATVMKKFPNNINTQVECKDGLVKYLENKLDVYSPERLSKIIKNMYSKIETVVQAQNKTMDDVIYIIPDAQKSYDLINYQYQLINNIPANKFITLHKSRDTQKLDFTDKVIVILDDCSLSGSSFLEGENFIYTKCAIENKDNNTNIIFAPLIVSQQAQNRILNNIYKTKRNNKDFLISGNNEDKNWNKNFKDKMQQKLVENALGDMGWTSGAHCIIFPYMCPDNNSELAANIGLFHNITYRENSDSFEPENFTLTNIKTFYNDSQEISKLTNKLLKKESKVNNE